MHTKILLIEDSPEMRENTAEILELSGYKVYTAEDGNEGVEKAKKLQPDLIICDIMMPELDGYGVLYRLQKEAQTASIPFIFLSAKAEKGDVRKGMNMGADDYLTKPFDEADLINAIQSRLQKNLIVKKDFSKDEEGVNAFFDEVSGIEELRKIAENKKRKSFRKKDVVYYEGDSAQYLYFLSKGKVRTVKTNTDGKEYTSDLYKDGDFFGYTTLLEDGVYKDTTTVLEDAEILLIPKEDFLSLIYSNRDVAVKFIKMLTDSIQEKETQMLNLAYNSVRKRVAEALVLLNNKYNTNNEDNYTISITREDLASIVGTATETVIRTLSEFKDDKFIEIQGRSITLKNLEKLRKMPY